MGFDPRNPWKTCRQRQGAKLWEDSQCLQCTATPCDIRTRVCNVVQCGWSAALEQAVGARRGRAVNTCPQLWPTKRDHIRDTHTHVTERRNVVVSEPDQYPGDQASQIGYSVSKFSYLSHSPWMHSGIVQNAPEHRTRMVNTPVSCLGGPDLKSRPGGRFSWHLSWFSSIPPENWPR
jgi:hypothetical protein